MSGAKGFQTLEAELQAEPLIVSGTIPEWLEGTLIRNGPAKFEVGSQKYRHWFDGLGMLHKFSLKNGSVSYTNRFIQSRSYTKARESGKISLPEFATDPCRSIFGRMFAMFSPEFTDNANVNVTRIANHYIAMTETPIPIEFDAETLATLGVLRYEDSLPGNLTTAHPHFDFSSKETFNYVTHFSRNSTYNVYRILPNKTERTLIGSIPVKEPGYMHSFGMTQNYVILAEFPLVVNPLQLLVGGRPFAENFRWKPERGTRFLVMDKKDGRNVKIFETDAFFAFHHVNAFEKNGEIILDIAAFSDAEIMNALYIDALLQGKGTMHLGKLRRYHLNHQNGTCREELMADTAIELPRINYELHSTKNYQYVYGTGVGKEFGDQLVKIDVQHKTEKIWRNDGYYPGEPVFIASPAGLKEDDGVILSVVLDADKGNSFLVVLDAASFTEISRAEVPHHIPFGFHGAFFS